MLELDNALAVQRMQDYIEAHLREPITLKQLANAAGYSPWHAAKLFSQALDDAPFEYIRKLRLTKAAQTLRDEGGRVLDVALDFQFDSHEGFTRAFHRFFGLSPVQYRKTAPPVYFYPVYSAKERYFIHSGDHAHKEDTMQFNIFTQITDFPARKLLLKRGKTAEEYFAYCEEVGCDVWGLLCSVKEALNEPMGLWLPDSLRPAGTSRYVQGVEVPADYAGVVPDGFDLIDLPACHMLLFKSEPYPEEEMGDAIAAVCAAIDRCDPTQLGCEWAPDAQPSFQLAPEGWRGYIQGRPVKLITPTIK